MERKSANRWMEVAEVAARQHGLVTTRQLLWLGFSEGAIQKGVRSGRLHRVHVGVHAVGHRAPSRHGRWMAAVLACGPGAALSHRSAATLRGVRDGEGPRVDVVSAGAGRSRAGIAVHRAPLPPQDVTVHDGIPVTAVHRTLVDLAHVLDANELARAVREAQFRGLFDRAATLEALERRPSRALRALIDDGTPVTSELEARFLRLVRRAGLPRPQGQRLILGHRVDFAWPDQRVAVELDGRAAHVTDDAFQRDRSQANLLQLAGWIVLRFTYADVTTRPAETAGRVRQALAR